MTPCPWCGYRGDATGDGCAPEHLCEPKRLAVGLLWAASYWSELDGRCQLIGVDINDLSDVQVANVAFAVARTRLDSAP